MKKRHLNLSHLALAVVIASTAGCGTLYSSDAQHTADSSGKDVHVDKAPPPPVQPHAQPVGSGDYGAVPAREKTVSVHPVEKPRSAARSGSPTKKVSSPPQDVIYQADGVLLPGGYAVIAAPENSVVSYHGRAIRVDSLGQVIVGFSRDAEQVALSVKLPDGSHKNLMFPLGFRDYDIQHVNGLKKKYVTPDARTLKQIRQDSAKAKAAREHYLRAVKGWLERPFIWPVSGTISGVYGSQRILNGKPRRPHYGVDIAAPEGTPVLAPASGKITLNENMVLSGKTVMIDHGYGLRSTFMHLNKVYVKNGDIVRKGQKIGEVGKTGRATGPHLHWGMSWYNIRLDPALFVQQKPVSKGQRVMAGSSKPATVVQN